MVRDPKGQDDMPRKTSSANWFSVGLDAWALAAESNMVIAMRMGQMALGGPNAAAEAQRMVTEKLASNMALGLDLATGKHGTDPETIISGSIAHYSKTVRANRRRLSK
jgi:hypothetical protein